MKTFTSAYTYNEAGPYLTMTRVDEYWAGYFRVHRYEGGSEVRQCIAIVPLGIYKKLKRLTRFLPDKFEDIDKLPRQILDLVYQGNAGEESASDILFFRLLKCVTQNLDSVRWITQMLRGC